MITVLRLGTVLFHCLVVCDASYLPIQTNGLYTRNEDASGKGSDVLQADGRSTNQPNYTESLNLSKDRQYQHHNARFVPSKNSENKTSHKNIFKRVQNTLTRSHEAIWASLSLTFLCILLVLTVGYSKMWKTYHGYSMPPVITFSNTKSTSVPFNDVIAHKRKVISYFKEKWKTRKMRNKRKLQFPFNKKKRKPNNFEMQTLLPQNNSSDESYTDEEFT